MTHVSPMVDSGAPKNHVQHCKVNLFFIDYIMIYLSMYTTGGDAGRFSTLLMHKFYTKYTKSSACIMVEQKSMEDAPRQILAQQGPTDHMDLGRYTPGREQEVGSLCFI